MNSLSIMRFVSWIDSIEALNRSGTVSEIGGIGERGEL